MAGFSVFGLNGKPHRKYEPVSEQVRAFVGMGNTLVFNDGKGDAIAFINKVQLSI